MRRPMMIVVPPSEEHARDRYAVVLGDCMYPGQTLAEVDTEAEADDLCVRLAWHYRVRALPMSATENRG